MRKLFKKSLACVLAVALCLTAMVGVVSVSADTVISGTITFADVEIEKGAASANIPVTLHVDSEDALLNVGYLYVEAEGATVTGIAADSTLENCDVNALANNTGFEVYFKDNGEGGLVDATVVISVAIETAPFSVRVWDYTSASNTEQIIEFGDVTKEYDYKACEHDRKIAVGEAKDATCTEDGITAGEKCEDCGVVLVEQEVIKAKGHTAGEVGIENQKAATCTVDGSYDEVVKCSVCGEVISRETKTVKAEGHKEAAAVIENKVEATCTTEGSFDTVVYCSVCKEEITRTTSTIEKVAHNYVDGKCTVCGEADPEYQEPVQFNGTFRIKTVSLVLAGEIIIKYTVGTDSGSLADPVIKELGLLVWDKETYNPEDIDYDSAYAMPCETDDYTFRISKFSFEMTDVVYTRAYAILTDGTVIYGIKSGANQAPVEYSVLKYATTQLKKSDADFSAANKKLVRAMLNYGAASQLENKYKTDNLANANLTDAEKVVPTATFDSALQQGHLEKATATVEDPDNTRVSGISLVVDSAVKEKYYIKVGANESKKIKNVTLLVWSEKDYEEGNCFIGTETYSELCTLEADGRYSAKSMGLYAFELRDDVYARGYVEYEDGTFGYTWAFVTSPEYYAKQNIDKASASATLKALLHAMMAYNDAAIAAGLK